MVGLVCFGDRLACYPASGRCTNPVSWLLVVASVSLWLSARRQKSIAAKTLNYSCRCFAFHANHSPQPSPMTCFHAKCCLETQSTLSWKLVSKCNWEKTFLACKHIFFWETGQRNAHPPLSPNIQLQSTHINSSSQLCDVDKMHPETSHSIMLYKHTHTHTHRPYALIHAYTLFLHTFSLTPQHWFDSCGAACQRCHADRKLLTQRGV